MFNAFLKDPELRSNPVRDGTSAWTRQVHQNDRDQPDFPDLIGRSVAAGAALLVNLSNDGWLDAGRGVAGKQHFAMAVFRAVETRRYLVRAATTGVSGVIDPFGRVVDTVAPRTAGVLTASVAGRRKLTPYVRLGDTFAFLCVGVAVGALAAPRWRLRRRRARLAPVSPAPS